MAKKPEIVTRRTKV